MYIILLKIVATDKKYPYLKPLSFAGLNLLFNANAIGKPTNILMQQ